MTKNKSQLSTFLTVLFGLAMLFASLPVRTPEAAASDDSDLSTINGSIAEVNAENREVTVHWMYDIVNQKYEDLNLAVAGDAMITKDTETIELDDLEEEDNVTMRYAPNAVPLPQAVNITVSAG